MQQLWTRIDGRAVALSDGVATTLALLLTSALLLWLGGCAQIGRVGADDARKATAVATAVGDAAGVACWPMIETTGNAIAAAGDKPGILLAIEEQRAVQMALQRAECQPVWAGVLAELLKATPVAPFIP